MYLQPNILLQGGKYKIVRHISSGGFGNTYEGVHTMMDTCVAIKEFFVKDFCNRDEQTLAPIPSEISIATRNAVLKAMTLIRADRPQTVEAFLSMLDSKITTTSDDEVTVVEVEDSVKQQSPKPKFEDLTFNVDGVSFKMIAVKGGTFKMGSNDSDANEDEKPIHDVALSSYYIGETQVTQNLWIAVMGNNPSYFKGDNLPVEGVSWNDCQKFISKLNSMTGQNFRLPTEAEWEYAARGGQKSFGYKYSGSNNIDEVGWYDDNSHTRIGWFGVKKGKQTYSVATKKSNELGIYDMSGNVYEWCSDWYGSYSSKSQTNPAGPNSGSSRVGRGGGWFSDARRCRSSLRGGFTPDFNENYVGLRLVLFPHSIRI